MDAQYEQTCGACGQKIRVGDEIVAGTGGRGWVHAVCPATET
jgi:hypothetical protein